ncbi:MAG: type II toxin-antitoxin system PemK/MazF family toxin [Chloroflexi bacterium]|nr:type II toxin-antitoxin system PemK/MazF family toxin [Chloroflexota bacterium]
MVGGDARPVQPRRGEVWKVDLSPTVGDEMAKIRPAVVVSSDAIGKLAVKTVVPLTTWKDRFASNLWMVRVEPDEANGLQNVSTADALQIRGVSLERFVERLGRVSSEVMDDIAAAIAIVIEFS